MSRRYEDFDEFCDPENPRTITYEDVTDALHRVRPFIPVTPCIPSHYQREFAMNLYYKLESVLKTGSFKERGALNVLELMALDKRKIGVVIASLGNQAVGICYYGAKLGVPVVVVMPTCVPINKLQRCHNLGAKVVVQGNNLVEAQRYARAIARDKGLTYINGRDHPHILAGYGTVALELLNQVPNVDAVIVPVGSGGLAAAVATVIKHMRPSCLVYGVESEKMPVFYKSLEKGDPVSIPIQASLADAISVSNVGVNSFHITQPLLDKMLLVNEDWIARSILHLMEKERFIVEGAAACSLAAIIGELVPELKLKNVVCVLSGGNIDSILLARCMDRGLAAEGRLVKFKVGIRDTSAANAELLKLLANGGYNVIREFQDHVWVENEIYTVEMKLVCETRGLEHALELKRIIERAYPCTAAFETEPFNDKRTCPCYVRKCM
ncbi:L-threonine ammonia-lyase-like [Epargyreus clarus]|uniref:L-threonine ammonia-lyase-like n=1 Tax=Epargyreus clarus TaxID=520877 RepID=UPI003C2E3CE7